jgi:precorrin-4/cobalt-precorrin-4 C11-methyltransferase
MRVYFIGAGPGAADLITVRGLTVLRGSKICIYAGSLVSREHLDALPADAEVHDSSRMSLDDIGDIFLSAKKRDLNISRLHTGDPTIYGAIAEQIAFCMEHGIECEIVPGVSSFTAAAAAIGKELTLPGISQTVILTRCEGRTPVPQREKLEALARSRSSMCIFLSAGLISETVAALRVHYPADTPVAVVSRVSWPDERVITGTLDSIAAATAVGGITRSAMVLVGRFLEGKGALSKLYDASFSHGFRKADGEQ